MAKIRKAQSGTKQSKPTPTYKNLRMGVANERQEVGASPRGGYGASALDSANYRRGFERGLRGGKEYPGERNVEKMGRWEGQNVGKKKPASKKTGGTIKKAQSGKTVRSSEKMSGGQYKIVTKSKSTPSGVEREIKAKRTLKGALQGVPKASVLNTAIKQKQKPAKFDIPSVTMRKGGKVMLKRADGSYSQRGLWDNLRSKAARNKATGAKPKAPTKAMLTQERKIKAKGK